MCMDLRACEKGAHRVMTIKRGLGSYHPLTLYNHKNKIKQEINKLKKIKNIIIIVIL